MNRPCPACIQNHQLLVLMISDLRGQLDAQREEIQQLKGSVAHTHHIQEDVLSHLGFEIDKGAMQ